MLYKYWSLVGEPNGKYSVRGVCVDGGEIREWTWCLGLRPKSFFFSLEIRRTWTGTQWTCPRPRLVASVFKFFFFAHARECIWKQNKLSIKKKNPRTRSGKVSCCFV